MTRVRIIPVMSLLALSLAHLGCASEETPQTVYQYWPPLQVSEDAASIEVAGKLFRYEIEKKTGLLMSARVMDDEFLAPGARMPDLFVSPESDCRKVRFEARHSPAGDVRIVEKRADEVVICANGTYADEAGKPFGMRYELTWRIGFDGFVKVTVRHVATAEGAIRWIGFNRVRLNPKVVDFVAFDTDLAKDWSYGPQIANAVPVPAEKDGLLFGGLALPFMHFGNCKTGIDFYQGRFHTILGYKDGEQGRYGPGHDAMGFRYLATEAYQRDGEYLLQMISIRDSWIPIEPGWEREDSFAFTLTPAKPIRMDLEQMRVYWLGPHQYRRRFRYPDEAQIRELAEAGINVIVGGANYRSGDYAHPENPEAVKRFIATCHKHGIRVIPYVTFSDLNHTLPAAREHLEEWMAEPKVEFRYFTTLMCFGCEDWREYWRKQVNALFDEYDFDGLYIDLWTSTLACVNERHGCDSRVKTYNMVGLREFAKIARQAVLRGRDDRFILANVNSGAWGAFCGLIDARLVGENTPFDETPPELRRFIMTSRRQGCQTLLLTRHLDRRTLDSFSLAFNAPYRPNRRGFRGTGEGPPTDIRRFWKVFRKFGVVRSRRFSSLHDPEVLSCSAEDCYLTAWVRDGRVLLSLATLAKEPVKTKLKLADPEKLELTAGKYRVVDALSGKPVDGSPMTLDELWEVEFTVDPTSPMLLTLTAESRE